MNRTFACVPLLLSLVACGGSSAPPPPVAVASAAPSDEELRPLSSREGQASTAQAGGEGTLPPGHPPISGRDPHGNPPAGAASSAGSISGTVQLSPRLSAGAGDVLYLMAKQGKATLAVQRIEKPAFPVSFDLSARDAMTSGVAFSGKVDVVARLSRTGDAIPSKGDLEGTTREVAVPARGVTVLIDRTRE